MFVESTTYDATYLYVQHNYDPYKQHNFTIYIVIGFSAIRKWDQAIRERNDFKDQFVKVKRQHEDAVKEINQNMNVRIKASKDIKRLTDERNAAMQVPLIKNEFKINSREMQI